MADYKVIDVEARPYLTVEKTCSNDPLEISKNLGEALYEVAGFMTENNIPFASRPFSLYRGFDPNAIRFESGFFISQEDMQKTGDRAAIMPAGKALHYTHVGSYTKLGETYQSMMNHIQQNNLNLGQVTWEIYIDDPTTTPEEEVRTEIYIALA